VIDLQSIAESKGRDFDLYFFGLGLQESKMEVFRLVMVSLAGWVNQQQERVIEGSVQCRERLGGLLRYYYRDAA
jgi:hypothetical protein